MSVFNRIAASTPVNKGAAVARDGVGIAYVPVKPIPAHHMHSHAPLPTVPFRAEGHDLSGSKFGLFTVVGRFAEDPNRPKPGRWVVRCVCGQYELRNTSAIKRLQKNIEGDLGDRCADCEKTKKLRDRSRPKRFAQVTA